MPIGQRIAKSTPSTINSRVAIPESSLVSTMLSCFLYSVAFAEALNTGNGFEEEMVDYHFIKGWQNLYADKDRFEVFRFPLPGLVVCFEMEIFLQRTLDELFRNP